MISADGGVGIDDPGVSPAGGSGDGRSPVGGDPDGRVGLLHGMGGDLHPRDPVVLAAVFDLVLGPEEADDFEGLVEAADALRAFDAEGGVFLVAVADAYSENEAATTHGVQGGGGLGDVHGVEEG